MTSSSRPAEQLANQGIYKPAWPEEPAGDVWTSGWIQRGQTYAEGIRLWRAQLRTAATIDDTGGRRLVDAVQKLGCQSAWDQSVIRYLLRDLTAGNDYQRVQAAAKLVAANSSTSAQRLGAALELFSAGFLVCALEAIKELVEAPQVRPEGCLELCALMVSYLPSGAGASEIASTDESMDWLQNVALHLQATNVLLTAAGTACGEEDRPSLLSQLDTLLTLAADSRYAPDTDQRAATEHVRARERRKQAHTQGKPLLRTLHHLACTGGTVISKCLAAMPDVALISEVNPFNRSGGNFEPTNPLLLLERSYRQLSTDEVIEDFVRQIDYASRICRRDDVDLIIRDHSHSDFCRGGEPSPTCPILDYLGSDYQLLSVVTVRHPLDSYLGLVCQGWNKHFSPSTLDEYSRRYLVFLDRYSSLPMLRYEDFCMQPEIFMRKLSNSMEVGYSVEFLKHFGSFSLSGDSGRKGDEVIEARPRRPVPEPVQAEIESSRRYSELLTRLGY